MDVTKLGLVADPVIKANARLEFEDGLRTGVSVVTVMEFLSDAGENK